MLAGLSWEAWLTLVVVVAMFAALIRNVARPDLILLGSLGVLLAAGVLTPKDAFGGLSNEGLLTVGALLVVAAGVQNTGALLFADRALFGRSTNVPWVVARLMVVSAFFSAFLNNTPLVAMLMPRVEAWCRKAGVSPSKLMMALSFGAILGGVTTVVGTSTNLVVSGLMESQGYGRLGFFDQTLPGLAMCIVGIIYFALVGQRLLPARVGSQSFEAELENTLFEVRVEPNGPLVGQTIEQAGLRDLGDAYLVHIRRGDQVIQSSPDEVLVARDVLAFMGKTSAYEPLLARPGLTREMDALEQRRYYTMPLYEAVVAATSHLVGKTLKEVDFRETYEGVVLGIHRRDGVVTGPLGRVEIQPADLLLIEAREGFDRRWAGRRDEFYLVAPHRGKQPKPQSRKAPLALAILIGVMATASLSGPLLGFEIPLVTTAFIGALLIIVTRCLTGPLARRAVDVSLLVIIAAALGIGKAIETTGLAQFLADGIIDLTGGLGPFAFLIAIYLATSFMTEIVTNNAAAALMLSVGLAASGPLGIDPKAFGIAVALAASSSFATPIGYQTNMMVMAPGGYRFTDFLKAGGLMNLITATAALTVLHMMYF